MKLFILLATFTGVMSQYDAHCPPQNRSYTSLQWDWQPATLALGVHGEYVELHCCAQHYTHIYWWEKTDAYSPWIPFRHSDTRGIDSSYGHVNETVYFKSVRFSDAHEYKCQVVDDSHGRRLQNIVELRVYNESSMNGPPILIEPAELNQTIYVELGKPVEFTCSVFFAVKDQCDSCSIYWQQIPNATSYVAIGSNSTANIYYTLGHSIFQDGAAETILHIRNVTRQDLVSYRCQPFNAFPNPPVVYFHLVEAEAPPSSWMRPAIISGVSIFVAIVVITVFVGSILLSRKSLQIRYQRLKKRMKTKPSTHASLLAPGHPIKVELRNDISYPRIKDLRGRHIARGALWVGEENMGHQWIEADFGKTVVVNSVVTQGCPHIKEWITEYRVKFSKDNETWYEFKDPQHEDEAVNYVFFKVNGNAKTREVNDLPAGILTRYVRVYPTEWTHTTPALRLDILGWRGTHDVTLIYPQLINCDNTDIAFGENLERKLQQTHSVFSSRNVDFGTDEADSIMDSIKGSRFLVIVISNEMLRDAVYEAEQTNSSGENRRAVVSSAQVPLMLSATSEDNNVENGNAVDKAEVNIESINDDDVFGLSQENRNTLKRYLNFINSCHNLVETIFVIHGEKLQWKEIKAGCKALKRKKECMSTLNKLEIAVKSCQEVFVPTETPQMQRESPDNEFGNGNSSHEVNMVVNMLEDIFRYKVLEPSQDAEELSNMLVQSAP